MDYVARLLIWEDKRDGTRLLDGEVVLGRLAAESAASITARHGEVLLECYVDRELLATLAAQDGLAASEVFHNKVLPSRPGLKSGDFGEILCRSVLQEWGDRPRFPVYKWRGRWVRDDATQGTDLIGYVFAGRQPSPHDVLVMCEVKTRSRTVSDRVVNDAFDGMKKDYASRMADSLFFQRRWLLEHGMVREAQDLARFSHPHTRPYVKRLVACVVHDLDTWRDEFLDALPNAHGLGASLDVDVVVFCIEDLANWMREVCTAAGEAADQ